MLDRQFIRLISLSITIVFLFSILFSTTVIAQVFQPVPIDPIPITFSPFIINQTPSTTQSLTFGYNKAYELNTVTGNQTHSYLYDKVGNRTFDGLGYTTNVLNQYTNVSMSLFTYDKNGSLKTEPGATTYVYDPENRLTKVTKGAAVTNYTYDALNRRVSKDPAGVKTFFIHDGDEVVEERAAAGTLVADYVYGSNIDEVLTMTRGTNTFHYFYDGLGSVRQITQPNGVVAENYDYDVYGKPVAASTKGNPIMFTGRWFDNESGLYYYRARYYHPTLGRFMQRDPIGYADGMNLYEYVGNNPGNWVDPSGLILILSTPDPELEKFQAAKRQNDLDKIRNECEMKPEIHPSEPSTFDQFTWGLSGISMIKSSLFFKGVKLGQLSDWIRFGSTRVSNQLIKGTGAKGFTEAWAIKGGGTNPITGFKLPFHYHIHQYNWFKHWQWFKYTPIL